MSSEDVKEFKVNEYITLKLENDKTIIYVNNRRFDQCKFLLLNIPVGEITSLESIQSIDDASAKLDGTMEKNREKINIPSEVEFWGHCSNLQVWYENDYDTRLLHSNLAFPLLKSLTDLRDPVAKKVIKDEIYKRVMNGSHSVIHSIINSGCFNYLNNEEIDFLLKNSNGLQKLDQLDLGELNLDHLPKYIMKFALIRDLFLDGNNLSTLPESIGSLKSLIQLFAQRNILTSLPKSIGNLKNLVELDLYQNKLTKLPESVNRLNSLKILNLANNYFENFPKPLSELKSLEYIDLDNNPLKNLSQSILEIKSLKEITIRKTNLSKNFDNETLLVIRKLRNRGVRVISN